MHKIKKNIRTLNVTNCQLILLNYYHIIYHKKKHTAIKYIHLVNLPNFYRVNYALIVSR